MVAPLFEDRFCGSAARLYPFQEAITIPHPDDTPDHTDRAPRLAKGAGSADGEGDAAGRAPGQAAAIALAAIGWIVADEARAQRYLDLTGLDPDTLRAGLGQPAVLASALDFLGNYEPDLLAAADQLEIAPAALIAARKDLA